jgi:transcription-repair coupling factor (superfamily II helicase)
MREIFEEFIERSGPYLELLAALRQQEPGQVLNLGGLAGSLAAPVVWGLFRTEARWMLLVAEEADIAERLRDDLLLLEPGRVFFFSGTGPTTVQALRALLAEEPAVVVTYAAALRTSLPAPDLVRQQAISVELNETRSFSALTEQLNVIGFQRREIVESSGEFAVRGGILDVFPYVGENPVRIEFDGDTVQSIREFEPLSQRSLRDLSLALLVPNLLTAPLGGEGGRQTLLDYLPRTTLFFLREPELARRAYDAAAQKLGEAVAISATLDSSPFQTVHLRSAGGGASRLDFGGRPQPSFNSSVSVLRRSIAELQTARVTVVLACESQGESARLKALLDEPAPEKGGEQEKAELDHSAVRVEHPAFHHGFIYPAGHLALFTEHEIFNRLKRRGRKRTPRIKGLSNRDLQQLRRGDYVVHEDFGIGQFAGLSRIRVGSAEQEVVKVMYAENDTLYVNLNFVNRLQKYSSQEGHVPRLTRLGSPDWDRLKRRTKKRVKDIARSLIRLYAQRKQSNGHAFGSDTPWQKELEASFLYEDTFDQAKATLEIKEDMESPMPMDRLICGDVGFGKTEVAIRAAFKAVMDGKQVLVLVPTTILAMQHFNTFIDRTARYGVQVRVISRFKPRAEQEQILKELKGGTLDILIGTHRLLSKDVVPKDLGLLIIDEEHRFGVAAKEKLRELRAEVDTLALTATPIPRTLHFSLMGARDLSIIATPPRNRLPVQTEFTQWNDDLIRDAVLRELHRGGQVYVVHDRVQKIDELTGRLQGMLPGVRIAYAHGQMHAHELEKTMLMFLEKKIDLLVSTKIIESGLDIPNVNTVIVNRADRFGMAELYQLRGRVGRSNVQAYAYLLTPPYSTLPAQTVKRLQALQEFNELGSGFNLAMRDLEIRGAGNLLGAEQSGFIESLGFETYTRILEEAVQELKAEEFRGVLKAEHRPTLLNDAVVEPELDAFIPREYITADTERLAVYRRLYALTTFAQLGELAEEIRDRFGRFPPELENLLGVVRLRLQAAKLGLGKITISPSSMEIEFPPADDVAFYGVEEFQQVMQRISGLQGQGVALRQERSTLKLRVELSRFSPGREPLGAGLHLLRLLGGQSDGDS